MIELLNQYGQAWAEFFGLAVLQNTLFLGIVLLVLHWLRNATARTRYAIAMIGIFKLLLPPFMPASLLSKWFAFPVETIDIQIGKPIMAASAETIEPTVSVSLIGLLFFLWLVTLSISLIIPALATVRLKLRLKNAEPIQSEELDNFSGKVYQSEKISMPLTIGFFSNKIFVPDRWNSWPAECRKMILHHEIAHIKRRDGLLQLIQLVAQAIYFFHPLVWILNSRINQYREMACDDASVATKRNSNMEYSRYLVKIAEEMTRSELGCSSASALIRQRNELLNRVQYQIMEVAMKHISKKRTGLIVGILLLLIFPFSWNTSYRPAIMPTDLAANESTEGAMKLFQQENGKIVGEVQNSKGGEAVPAANIMIDGTNLGAASDKNGKFEINNVPPGKYTLKASMLGFIMLELRDIKVESGKASNIRIHLKPDITDVQKVGVEITPPPPPPKEKLVNIKEKQPGEVPPPPPPPPVKDKETLVDYDTPPEVVGGFGEVAKAIKYPESARKAGVAGTVTVGVQIDEQGKVLEAKILESLNADCDQAAVDALKSVNWKPAIKDKKPVKTWVTVPVRFKLK